MKPQVFKTFGELKTLLESLSEEELKQPVRAVERHDDCEPFEVYIIAVDDVGLVLIS